MLIRSYSTSATAGNLFSDSPSRDSDSIKPHHDHSLSFSLTNLTPSSGSTSSPASQVINQDIGTGFRGFKGFRRAWSDSNLERLAYNNTSCCDKHEFHNSNTTPNKFPHRRHHETMLHTSPSFSIFNTNGELDDDEQNDQGGIYMEREEGLIEMRTVDIGDRIESLGSGGFSFGKNSMVLIEEEGEEGEREGFLNGIENFNVEEGKEPVSPPLYLAAGLGIDFGGRGDGGFPLILAKIDESGDAEEYYKRMIDEYPCHPVLLSNYARLLQSKGDLHGAEEYYRYATLSDPGDGEVLMQYAKVEWELHHDQDRAVVNFERAVQAAPQDSHVLAAYASFLWEIDDEEGDASKQHIKIEEEGIPGKFNELVNDKNFKKLTLPAGLLIDMGDHATSDANKGGNSEEYYKRMVEENPCNPLFLRNYAEFLSQSKGDLQGAEEYYSRAVLVDPGDGEILSQYAKLVWELYHDHDKASCYFERAVQATPEDSYVLAAYANFLWETENDEDNTTQFQIPNHHEGVVPAANA